jgi:hypothetical protein
MDVQAVPRVNSSAAHPHGHRWTIVVTSVLIVFVLSSLWATQGGYRVRVVRVEA